MPTERELKFSTSDASVPGAAELESALEAAGCSVQAARSESHTDLYFDDSRLSLSRAGLALRRRHAGRRVLAALKTRGRVAGALHERDEIELPVEGAEWPRPIFDRVSVVTPPAWLQPHTEIRTERTSIEVMSEGRPVARLSFDRVSARPQGSERAVAFSEVEIEALGDAGAELLQRIAAAVGTLLPLSASGSTKLERARELLMADRER